MDSRNGSFSWNALFLIRVNVWMVFKQKYLFLFDCFLHRISLSSVFSFHNVLHLSKLRKVGVGTAFFRDSKMLFISQHPLQRLNLSLVFFLLFYSFFSSKAPPLAIHFRKSMLVTLYDLIELAFMFKTWSETQSITHRMKLFACLADDVVVSISKFFVLDFYLLQLRELWKYCFSFELSDG